MTKLYRNTVRVALEDPDTGAGGAIEWVDDPYDTTTTTWALEHRPATSRLALRNPATGVDSLWVAPDDTLHVQDLFIEGDSSLDAGTLDSLDSTQFVRADADDTITGNVNVTSPGSLAVDGAAVLTTADEGTLDAGTLGGADLETTRPSATDDGTVVVAGPSDLNFGQYLSVSDDGDGTVTIDNIGGNAVGSTETASGNDETTTFTLGHALGTVPASVTVTPLTEDASADRYITDVTPTSVTIEYSGPPPAGTDNLEWYVTAFGNDGSGRHSISVEDDSAQVSLAHTVDFGTGLSVASAGPDTVTVTADVDTNVSVSDDAAQVLAAATDLNFGANLAVADDGDGTVSISAADTYASVSSNAATVVAEPTDINFGDGLSVTDDGDSTVTVHGSTNASTLGGLTSSQFLRADAADTHTGTLSVTTLAAADGDAIAVPTGDGIGAASGPEVIRPRETGLQSQPNGANAPTDYGLTVAADATIAFVEPVTDTVAGWVDTNTESATLPGGVRVGDAGGAPAAGAAVDARGDIHVNQNELVGARFENRTTDPADPAVGQFWMRTDVTES